MADERVIRVQHTHETNALSYGHFGTATYNEDNHEWAFLRGYPTQRTHIFKDDNGPVRSNASDFQLIHEEVWNSHEHSSAINASTYHVLRGDGASKLFLKRTPDAAVAVINLPSSAYKSKSPAEVESHRRPLGDTLAFGSAGPPFEASAHNNTPATPIVAFPAGGSTGKLKLVVLKAHQIAVPDNAGLQELCTVPSISDQEAGYWSGSLDRIQHVSSSTHRKGTQFLVVRSSGTTILRPAVADVLSAKQQGSTEFDGAVNMPDLLVDPCPLVTIPSSRTGEQPHAHAELNPQNEKEVAIVDVRGRWSVWKLQSKSTKSLRVPHQIQLYASSDLHSVDRQSLPSKTLLHEDGWHRICWLENGEGAVNRVLVCSRRFAAVFDDKGKLVTPVDMRLGPQSDQNQILDVKRSGRRRDRLFILTTSRLMIFTSSEVSWKDPTGNEPPVLVCSWNHFRDRTDLSLSMSVLEFSEDTWVLLHSTSSDFAVIYHFGNELLTSNVVSKQDPSPFPLPQQLKGWMGAVNSIVLCPIDFTVQNNSPDALGFGLVKLIACTVDGAIVEALYRHNTRQFSISHRVEKDIWTLPLPQNLGGRTRSAAFVTEDDLDEFMVADDVGMDHPVGEADTPAKSPTSLAHPSLQYRNWQNVLDHGALQATNSGALSMEAALEAATERFNRLQTENEAGRMHLLADFLHRCRITDVEQDSEAALSWLENLELQEKMMVESADSTLSHKNLLEVYDDFMSSYIGSLSSGIPDRNRVNRERLVRQLVGDAFLGTVILRIKKGPETSDSPTAKSPSMPERGLHTSSVGPESDGHEMEHPSSSQSPAPKEEPAMARLGQYAGFRREVPAFLLSHNAGLSTVLAHIPDSIEEDPAKYSYQHTNQRLKLAQEEMATQSLDPRERRKAARQAARLQRKLDKTAKTSQEVNMQRTLLPSITSQIRVSNLPGRDVQSSQPVVPESSQAAPGVQRRDDVPGLNMTQPERGAFGTRTVKPKGKTRGTKRQAGF